MTTAIAPFTFQDQDVRVVTDEHGEPWFVAADVARILGYRMASDMTRTLDEDERGTRLVRTPSGEQEQSVLTEPGLYAAINQRQTGRIVDDQARETVRQFKRWVSHDVLPAIRKTGSYSVTPETNPAEITRADLARMVLAAEEELAITSAALTAARPAIEYHERYVIDSDVVTVKVWGQQFGQTEQQAFQLLRDKKILYRHGLGERWSASKGCREQVYEYRPYAGRQSFAWFDLRPQHNAPRHHNGQVRQTCYVRQAYALDLAKCLGLVEQTALAVTA